MLHVLLLTFILLAAVNNCESQTQSPEEYFGGIDAQPYLDWVDENGGNYDKSHYMRSSANPDNGAAIHWHIDKEYIHLAVAVRATGWVGFGIAEAGGMFGADVALYEAKNPDSIMDKHILDVRFPIDDSSQDWELKESRSDRGFLIFEAKRLLNTDDPQDRQIVFGHRMSLLEQLKDCQEPALTLHLAITILFQVR